MSSPLHLLIVDDDRDILSLLTKFFQRHAIGVSVAETAEQAMLTIKSEPLDLVILDLMLPGEDGLSLCRRLQNAAAVPIIMLTAKDDLTDRIVGLEIGADDYITKPFDARELLARIRAVLRRASTAATVKEAHAASMVLQFAGWRLDIARRELRSEAGTWIPLTSREFNLLRAFLEHPERVLSRDQLLDLAHGDHHEAYDRSIDLQVYRLRRKLAADPRHPDLIRTVRNGGYMFAAPVSRR